MERATDLLEIVHTDVCGPMSVEAHGGYRFLTFKEFQSEVENHRNKKIKFLRSDRGDEYLSYEFGLQLKQM